VVSVLLWQLAECLGFASVLAVDEPLSLRDLITRRQASGFVGRRAELAMADPPTMRQQGGLAVVE
jgi:hypothetical protein